MKSKRMFSTTVGKGSLGLRLETRGEAENNLNTDTRLAPAEKNIGFQQMPTRRKLLAKASRSQVKKSLGFPSGTHYETMLHNPTSKLKQFMYPGMKASDIKKLVKMLESADVKKKNRLRSEARQRTLEFNREDAIKGRALRAAARQERATRREDNNRLRQNHFEVRSFLSNNKNSAKVNVSSEEELQTILDSFLFYLQEGEKFLIEVGQNWYTFSLAKYEELTRQISNAVLRFDALEQTSDAELLQSSIVNSMTFSRPAPRIGANFRLVNGEFFPYLHDFDDPDLIKELANLGCWTAVDPENYESNCLLLAFQSAGVSDKVLQAMKHDFLQRKISRKNIKQIAETHNLCVKIRTDGDKNIIVYGNEKAAGSQLVQLAIIKGVVDHYIHFYKTKFNSFAIEHYDEIKHKKNWWALINDNKRQNDRGMNSLDLLRAISKTARVKKIDLSTEGIFRTQFVDRFNETEFSTLHYPEGYSKLFHDPRVSDAEIADAGAEKIAKVREKLHDRDPASLSILDAKFLAQGFGPEEQLKHLNRALRNTVIANVFFDFESSAFDKHEDYCGRFSEFNDALAAPHEVRTTPGETAGEAFLKQMVQLYGAVDDGKNKNWTPPIIKLLAHNFTYDYSFIAPFLSRVQLTEKGTKIVCGKAHYSQVTCKQGASPNAQLINWLKVTGVHYLNMEKINSAACVLKKTTTFVTRQGIASVKGINSVVKGVIKDNAPWGEFEPQFVEEREYRAVQFIFQDTISMIDMPLSKFGKSFGLEQCKEIFPHSLMTKKFVKAGGIATLCQLREVCQKEKIDCNELLRKLEDADCIITPKPLFTNMPVRPQYDMIKYSSYYCKVDVMVLKEGWRTFRNLILEKFQLDTFHYLTLASLSDQYFIDQGCFDQVHQIAGVPRAFIANCTIGGRVMCANNQRKHTKKKLADFDGVSLYPSAMKRLGGLGGYLKGAPKVWMPEIDLSLVDGYFVKIKVTSIKKRYRFPITRIKDDSGGCHWTNDLVGKEIFVDKFTLEDLVTHSKITHVIQQGYYFNEGRNPKIEKTISTLFEERLRIKKADPTNPMQLIIKLMMNSSYGKTGLRPIDTDVKYVNPKNRANFIQNHFNHIKCGTDMPNGQTRIELYKEIDTHFNRQHVACEVLSMSKVIMNEVMCLAEDIGADIEYTDTDSMHIDFYKVTPLADAFRLKYDRELIGKQLGQFHVDFEDLAEGGGEVWAKESYFLGKKTYIDLLTDDKGNLGYHIRMKGIPTKCINAKVNSDYGQDALLLYKDLYEGKEVKFDLTTGGNCCFKTGKDHHISTVSMTRTVCFPLVAEPRTTKRQREEESDFTEGEEEYEWVTSEEASDE